MTSGRVRGVGDVDSGSGDEEGGVSTWERISGPRNFVNIFPRPVRRRSLGAGDREGSDVDGRMSLGARRRSLNMFSLEVFRLGTRMLTGGIGGVASV